MDVILIGQLLGSIEGIFQGALAESPRSIPCNLWNSWGNSNVGTL